MLQLHGSASALLLPALLAGLMLLPAAPAEAGLRCAGRDVTLRGTPGDDVLVGGPGPDVIHGLGGDDVIKGRGGRDRLCGGPGEDEIHGGRGRDRIRGGSDPDVLLGGNGLDVIHGGKGPDACFRGGRRTTRSCVPVVAAAGDISCDPYDDAFNGGKGSGARCRQRATSNLIAKVNVRRVLTLGDNQYEDGSLAKFRASYDRSWGRFRGRTRPSVGNHEYQTADARGYFSYFGSRAGPRTKGWYDHRLNGWHLLALNSECAAVGGCDSDSAQVAWLRARLDAVGAPCVLGYWHHPRFSSGLHGDHGRVAAFFRALADHGGDLALVGHDHDYERFAPLDGSGDPDPAGVRQFVVGTGGKNLRPFRAAIHPHSERRRADTHGVLFVALRPRGYVWHFAAIGGSSFSDLGEGSC